MKKAKKIKELKKIKKADLKKIKGGVVKKTAQAASLTHKFWKLNQVGKIIVL